MITSTHNINAIKAIQHLCIMARFFSTDKDKSEINFKILDAMDHLFSLLCSAEDKTQEFHRALNDMIDSVPQCKEALRIYQMK